MNEFQDLLGSLLRDISHARVMSDLYSREVSGYYENDAMLRHFPVPRADIIDMEIELKFAFDKLNQVHESTLSKRLSYQIYLTTNEIIDRVQEDIRKYENTEALSQEYVPFIKDIHEKIYATLKRFIPIDESLNIEELNVENLRSELIKSVQKAWDELGKDIAFSALLPDFHDFIKGRIFNTITMIEFTIKTVKDFQVGIHFEAGIIKNLPPQALASIKLKVGLKNYQLVKTGEEDGKTIRRLIEE